LSCDAPRIPTVALKVSNTSSELYKEGWIRAANMPGDSHWPNYVSSVKNAFTGLSEQKTFQASTGAHGTVRPDDDDSFKPRVSWRAVGTTLTDSFYPIETDESFIMFGVTLVDPNARSLEYKLAMGIDYQSKDTWRNVQKSPATAEDWRKGIEILKRVDQFHTNEFHVKDILDTINKIAGGVKKAADVASNIGSFFV